ncbi:CheR family methyltransferase [Acidisoma sp.]|uniref:CheR family methyltransferase n=1 Tax=Acidisoma sp. TaxID=1872115 RepID=UPI003B0090B4
MSQAFPEIQAEDFDRFRELFYRKTGIVFSESKRYFVDRRLGERIEATRSESFGAYMTLLRLRDPRSEELQNLINAMTVNETYFYREAYQFKCLVGSMLPELTHKRRSDDQLQIWSMPCATGEEPYTIAIYLLEEWADVDRWDVRLIATDIDTRVLDQAREGTYFARAVQHVPPRALNRYFMPVGSDRWQVIPDLRGSIEFRQANITNLDDMNGFRNIDVIFCRNLLIYFDDTSRRQAVEFLFDALRPGGFICLGHAESMSRISSLFAVKKFPDGIVYQKPL